MTAPGENRVHRSVVLQLLLISLIIVIFVGCNQKNQAVNAASPGEVLRPPPTIDTPIVISGGSIDFEAKHTAWKACNTTPPTPPITTCLEATFDHADKKGLTKYQFDDGHGHTTSTPITTGASVTKGWEVDVVDTNPENQHMVLVCAELSNHGTCDPVTINSDFIYVIAKGGGTFETPDSTKPKKIVYHDGQSTYDNISNIFLNATNGTGGIQQPCNGSHCSLKLATP